MKVCALNSDVEIMLLGEAYSPVIKINSTTFEKVEIFSQTEGWFYKSFPLRAQQILQLSQYFLYT